MSRKLLGVALGLVIAPVLLFYLFSVAMGLGDATGKVAALMAQPRGFLALVGAVSIMGSLLWFTWRGVVGR
jgi:hypothetical protein